MVNREDNMRIVDNAVKLFLSQSDGKGGAKYGPVAAKGKDQAYLRKKNANIRL